MTSEVPKRSSWDIIYYMMMYKDLLPPPILYLDNHKLRSRVSSQILTPWKSINFSSEGLEEEAEYHCVANNGTGLDACDISEGIKLQPYEREGGGGCNSAIWLFDVREHAVQMMNTKMNDHDG